MVWTRCVLDQTGSARAILTSFMWAHLILTRLLLIRVIWTLRCDSDHFDLDPTDLDPNDLGPNRTDLCPSDLGPMASDAIGLGPIGLCPSDLDPQ